VDASDDTTNNLSVVRRFHERLWGAADFSAIDDVIEPDAVTHWGDDEAGAVDAIRRDVERYFGAFSDVRTSVDDLVGGGDKVVLRWTTTGTHTGPYGKVEPTGRTITMRGVDIYRLAGGRIVEAWALWDALDVYQQLGIVSSDVGP
jgi:predicted ester cyclase